MKNDEKILELKTQIALRKEQLKKQNKRFTPITNCIIELESIKYNLQVLSKSQLMELLIRLNLYLMSAKDLNITDVMTVSGYSISDWMTDIRAKLESVKYKDDENKLKAMEDKLQNLLSDEKKTEIEIDEIAAAINSEVN